MARFRFAVFKERLELLTPTKGISDNLNTDSASFDFRTPEWEGLSKWAHFTNYDYEGGVEYDFNLINDEIPVDEGLNLPPGVWDVYVHAEVIDAQAIVRRLVTNVVSIVSDQSDAYDGQYLPPIGPSVAEQIDAKATAAWDAKITSASAEIHNDVGEAYADLEITGENGNKNLHFDFHNIKGEPGSDGEQGEQGEPGNSIYSIVRTSGTGAPGTVDTYTVTLTDGTIGGTFEVYNGADGAGTVQSVSGILPDASGDIPLIIFGNTAPTTSTAGYVKQLYFDTSSSLIYMCTDDSDPYVWALASGSVTGVKGDAESTYRTGNVNITAANVGAAPEDHASSATTYGKGTDSNYGHVKLSDSTSSTSAVSGGIAATPKAVKDAYDLAGSKTSAMIVDVSDTQPTDPDNKLWILETVDESVQIPTMGDLTSDNVANDSLVVSGATVTDALETLAGAVGGLGSDDIVNESQNVTGVTVTDAIDNLNGAITNLKRSYATPVWELGTLRGSNGSEETATTQIRSNFIRCKAGTEISCASGYQFNAFMYDIDDAHYIGNSGWQIATKYTLAADRNIRLLARNDNLGAISDITSVAGMVYIGSYEIAMSVRKIFQPTSAVPIPSSGSNSNWIALEGLTGNCVLIAWNFSSCAENSPPANLTWWTGSGSQAGYFRIDNLGGTPPTGETCRPVFVNPY